MILYELLQVTKYDQLFHVYISNAFDQNYPIGDGDRKTLLNEEECEELFDHLLDEVDMITISRDGSLVVRVKDEHFNENLEEQYDKKYVAQWDTNNPDSRPFKFTKEIDW